ncbi:auxin-responsive protein SAUR68-like [Rhodamnia argentea]|uniref:Auxin-responsive protein SAUR68-like n=1 Tax=Rhodamnia argentea TaxID=178133 RepID=A0A8B8NK21_9MYRT|nr:auxin-responsive protein SAUR68-like [Rhodamnia argentea]
MLSAQPEISLQLNKKQIRSSVENYLQLSIMISTKKLIQMARKWQKMAANGRRKRIPFQRTSSKSASANANRSSFAQKGHFVVYTTDERRFVIPLSFLSNDIVKGLFRASEEVFGIPCDGPIMLPVDAPSMEYTLSLIRRGLAKDQENALLMAFSRLSCSSSLAFNQALENPEMLVCY